MTRFAKSSIMVGLCSSGRSSCSSLTCAFLCDFFRFAVGSRSNNEQCINLYGTAPVNSAPCLHARHECKFRCVGHSNVCLRMHKIGCLSVAAVPGNRDAGEWPVGPPSGISVLHNPHRPLPIGWRRHILHTWCNTQHTWCLLILRDSSCAVAGCSRCCLRNM